MEIARLFVILGIVFLVTGLLFYLLNSGIPFFRFFGNLPGDIKIEKENFSFYFPLTTSLLISAILSLILFLIQRLRG